MQTPNRTTLSSQAVESIKGYITANSLMPGDKLPPEREFCRMLGVSSRVVREALKALESIGVISIRVGDGLYVSGMDYSKLAGHLSVVLQQNGRDIQYLGEARRMLELAALDVIVERIDDMIIDRLESLVDRMATAQTIEENVHLDAQFHKTIMEATENPVFVEFCKLIDEFFNVIAGKANIGDVGTDPEEHRQIVEALRHRDFDLARTYVRSHGVRRLAEILSEPSLPV